MKVAIVGAGFSGAYTARRLVTSGYCREKDIEVFDSSFLHSSCGITACAYGIDFITLREAVQNAQLGKVEDYVLRKAEYLVFGTQKVKNLRICTFNKRKFIRDCLQGIEVKNQEFSIDQIKNYDLVIDATARRAILGLNRSKWRPLFCCQIRVGSEEDIFEDMYFEPVKGFGYKWVFPLNFKVAHVGMGILGKSFDYSKDFESQIPNVVKIYRENFEREYTSMGCRVICRCFGLIRASSPKYSMPIVVGNVAAVGESAGMISSLTGGGCKEAIEGIEILIDNVFDLEEYEKKLVEAFKWADFEFEIIDSMAQGKKLSLKTIAKIRKNPERVGIRLSLLQMYRLGKEFLVF